eukprot:1163702-Alexandrium_andersonii.AAC.1
MEHSHSLGFPGLGDSISPCPFCYAGPEDYFSQVGLSPLGPKWQAKQQHQWEAACAACEVNVPLTRDAQVQLRA